MKIRILLLGFLVQLCTLTIFGNNQTEISLFGSVKEAESKKAIPFASLVVKGAKIATMSDSNGVYKLENLPMGENIIEIYANGYQSQEKMIVVKSGEAVELNVELEPIPKSPFGFEASYIGEAVNNFSGGIKQGGSYLGMANIKLSFETEKARWWKGGIFFIHGANTHGGEPSKYFIGDFQGMSNIEAGNLTYLHELWYKQTIGKFTFTVGLQDLNAEFMTSEYAGHFINSSFGVHSTIADNVPTPIFPLTAFGIQFQYRFSDKITAKMILFDGFPDSFDVNPYNLRWRFEQKDGVLAIPEITFNYSLIKKLEGVYKIGGYSHKHYVSDMVKDSTVLKDNFGFYFVGDQTIYKKANGQKMSVFTQASVSPQELNENWYYLGMGIHFHGIIQRRIKDVFGFAIAHAGMKNNLSETIFELTYKLELNENIFVQPDFQYVVNPMGYRTSLDNAFIGNLRFGVNF